MKAGRTLAGGGRQGGDVHGLSAALERSCGGVRAVRHGQDGGAAGWPVHIAAAGSVDRAAARLLVVARLQARIRRAGPARHEDRRAPGSRGVHAKVTFAKRPPAQACRQRAGDASKLQPLLTHVYCSTGHVAADSTPPATPSCVPGVMYHRQYLPRNVCCPHGAQACSLRRARTASGQQPPCSWGRRSPSWGRI